LDKAGDVLGSGVSTVADITGDIVESYGEKSQNQKVKPTKNLQELLDNANAHENEAEWLP